MSSLLLVNSLVRLKLKNALVNNSNIRQLHQSFTRRVAAPSKLVASKTSIKYVLGGSFLICGGGLTLGKFEYDFKLAFERLLDILSKGRVLYCKEDEKRNRTAHYEETLSGSEILVNKKDSFDWYEFLRLIYKEKWLFLAATVVS